MPKTSVALAQWDQALSYLHTARDVVDSTMHVAHKAADLHSAIDRCHRQLMAAPLSYPEQALAEGRADALHREARRADTERLDDVRFEMRSLLDAVGTRVADVASAQGRQIDELDRDALWLAADCFRYPIARTQNVLRSHDRLRQEIVLLERMKPSRIPARTFQCILRGAREVMRKPDLAAQDLCQQLDQWRATLRNTRRLLELRDDGGVRPSLTSVRR